MDRMLGLRVWTAIHQTYHSVMHQMRGLMAQHEIGDVEYLILFHAAALKEFPQSKFTDLLNVSKGAVSIALKTLIRKGFLEALPHATDRRQRLLRLTPRGHDVVAKIFAERGRIIEQVFGEIDDVTGKKTLATLAQLNADRARFESVMKELDLLEPHYFPATRRKTKP